MCLRAGSRLTFLLELRRGTPILCSLCVECLISIPVDEFDLLTTRAGLSGVKIS